MAGQRSAVSLWSQRRTSEGDSNLVGAMYYVCHTPHILVKRKMTNRTKKTREPLFLCGYFGFRYRNYLAGRPHSGVKIEQLRDWVSRMLSRMNKNEVETKQLSSVSCPTCGVSAGMRCVRHSGAVRTEPHVDRKLSALGAAERKLR